MREGPIKRVVRPRLLALVLALALTWYAINPAPGPLTYSRGGGDAPPGEKRDGGDAREGRATLPARGRSRLPSATTRQAEGDGELDWPVYLTLD